MPHLSIRIDFDDKGRLGPGKVTLLEQIEREQGLATADFVALQLEYPRR